MSVTMIQSRSCVLWKHKTNINKLNQCHARSLVTWYTLLPRWFLIVYLNNPCTCSFFQAAMDLKWLGLGLPVLAAMLCTTLWQNKSPRETMQDMPAVKPTLDDEPRLSSVISKITKDVEDVQCIYYFPSPQTLQNSSLERIWLDQIISKNWCPMKLDKLREEDHIAVLEAYERVQQKPPHQDTLCTIIQSLTILTFEHYLLFDHA